MVLLLLTAIATVCLSLMILVFFSVKPKLGSNIFLQNQSESSNLGLHDIRTSYHRSRVPENIDAIVIGSGISGLTTAAVLAKVGKKVLVLEQHDTAGGMTHSFTKDGYEFDTGFHYVGSMDPNKTSDYFLFDAISEGRLKWHPMTDFPSDGVEYAIFNHHENGSSELSEEEDSDRTPSPIKPHFKSVVPLEKSLIEMFPEEKDAIMKLFKEIDRSQSATNLYYTHRLLVLFPSWLYRLIGQIVRLFSLKDKTFLKKNVLQMFEECGIKSQKLIDLLSFNICFNCALPLSVLLFSVWANMMGHYREGGWFPVGGSSAVPTAICPTIRKAGGEVLVRAPVTNIIISDNKVTGVEVRGKDIIYAPMVISSAGVYHTYMTLLNESEDFSKKVKKIRSELSNGAMKPSASHFSIFIGLNANPADLALKSNNYWYMDQTPEREWSDVMNRPDFRLPQSCAISFPAAKDPMFTTNHPDKSTAHIIVPMSYEWVKQYKLQPLDHRDAEYVEMKQLILDKYLGLFSSLFPSLDSHIDGCWTGSPITQEHYFNCREGGSYGVEQSKNRLYSNLNSPVSPVRGLYLVGADIISHGVPGAAFSAVYLGCIIFKRNLFSDLEAARSHFMKGKKYA